jgi:hypothetical protein
MKMCISRCLLSVNLFSLALVANAQTCDTKAFTYNQSSHIYVMPGGFSPSQCSCLQAQWDAVSNDLQNAHQSCLDANVNGPHNPNSGSGPGSACSVSSCQGLHTALYSEVQQKAKEQVNACNAAVANYVQQVQAQQAIEQQQAQQQAAQQTATQQQRAQQLQATKQALGAIFKAQQDATQAANAQTAQLLQRGQQDQTDAQKAAQALLQQGSTGGDGTSSPSVTVNLDHPFAAQDLNLGLSALAGPDQADGGGFPPTSSGASMPPIPEGALMSPNSDVQQDVAELNRLSQMYSQNQSWKTDLAANSQQDSDTALTAAGLAALVSLKGPADSTAAVLGLSEDPLSKAFSATYGLATATATALATPTSQDGKSESTITPDVLGAGGGFISTLGEYSAQTGTTDLTRIAGVAGQSGGALLGAAGNASAAAEAYNNGDGVGYATNGVGMVGNLTTATGALMKNTTVTGYGGAMSAAATIVQSNAVSGQALWDAANDLSNAAVGIPANYNALLIQSQALDQQIAQKYQATYLHLLQLMQAQQQNQPITVSIPITPP